MLALASKLASFRIVDILYKKKKNTKRTETSEKIRNKTKYNSLKYYHVICHLYFNENKI